MASLQRIAYHGWPARYCLTNDLFQEGMMGKNSVRKCNSDLRARTRRGKGKYLKKARGKIRD